MLLKRFYDAKLAQASYLLGCQTTGESIVVDPNRDVEQYLRAARDEGVRVTHVTETHIHADFVSGSRELAHRSGAQLLLSSEGGEDWRYAFAADAGARLLHDGDVIMVGAVRLDVRHTPGHTPEHLTFLITDTAATDTPLGALTGDFIFAGDVGRPDLLERAANVAGTMDSSARALFASIQRFITLPDHLQLWPGHGAGSACGKSLGAVPSTSLGYEKIANWALAERNEDAFVRHVLSGQPEPPKYFGEMKRINRDGPPDRTDVRRPAQLAADALAPTLAVKSLVVDTRPAADYAKGHVPGTINIPFNKSFTTYAGSLIPFDGEFFLIARAPIDDIVHDLSMIGFDRCAGYFDEAAIDAWQQSHAPGTVSHVDAETLVDLMRAPSDVQVIDVRGRSEWDAGHLPGVENIPLGQIPDRLADIPRDRPVVVHCQGNGRAAIAASILKANGFENVASLTGGFGGWAKEGLPVEVEEQVGRH